MCGIPHKGHALVLRFQLQSRLSSDREIGAGISTGPSWSVGVQVNDGGKAKVVLVKVVDIPTKQ